MPLNRDRTQESLKRFDFRKLFLEELGWDRHESRLEIPLDGKTHVLEAVARKRGMAVYLCEIPVGTAMPDYATRLKIERTVAKTAHEHLIVFTDSQNLQIWQWVKREPSKPAACRENEYRKGDLGDALILKLEKIAFTLDEEEKLDHLDVTRRTRQAFDVERVTKKFYERFQQEHSAFLKFIKGIENEGDHEWYASIMLNRLMFIYFVQRKGFLDKDTDYLRKRLKKNRETRGKDKFYSFYRYFLLRLFHEGLGGKARSPELDELLGKIPYLNGGLFEEHEIEKRCPKIQIPDDAFERVFDFFEGWDWVLDPHHRSPGERPDPDKPHREEINPDVLGHIFEKYINQKQMGAYYTKEDITEYISKNTVLPFLFDSAKSRCKVAFENPGGPTVWDLLQDNPDKYIYPAVRHGLTWNYVPDHPDKGMPLENVLQLPSEIEIGLDTTKPNLIERRKSWNKSAPDEFALPTETWREVVARRQRYEEVRRKLAAGEVRDVNDFITLNLDLRQFAEDSIAGSQGPELLRAFWHAIRDITVLDPTCGSGAFLFAALNILEPLYEGCLDGMERFIADEDRVKPKSPEDTLRELIAYGESVTVEFKQTARWNVRENRADKTMEQVILKTVAAFLNTDGGDLLIGVKDEDQSIFGIEVDLQLFGPEKRNRDAYENWLTTLLLGTYGKEHSTNLRISFIGLEGKDVCRVSVLPSAHAVYVTENGQEVLYVRTGNSTRSLNAREAVAYDKRRFTDFKPPRPAPEPAKARSSKKFSDFRDALEVVKNHPNHRYFIFKSIILNNLYGVDIMEEAVEICKLRLFLKLAAQVDPNYTDKNLGIEPLPDIDFNIRAGNTLVGFATRAEIEAVSESDWVLREEVKSVLEAAEDAENQFKTFKLSQMEGESPGEFKRKLNEKFSFARRKCDTFLAEIYEHNISKKPAKLFSWRDSHKPFHWFIEFNGIMSQGGFDVIIGNPPYVATTKADYNLQPIGYKSLSGGNLYNVVIERSFQILKKGNRFGMIVPVSVVSGDGFINIAQLLFSNKSWVSSFSNRPGKLFQGVEQRLTIVIAQYQKGMVFSTEYQHWYESERAQLFAKIGYSITQLITSRHMPRKVGTRVSFSIANKIYPQKNLLQKFIGRKLKGCWFHDGPTYWIRSLPFEPKGNQSANSSHFHRVLGVDALGGLALTSILASSIFYMHFKMTSNCRDFGVRDINAFRLPILPDKSISELARLGSELGACLKKTAKRCSRDYPSGTVEYDEYYPSSGKSIIDEIDTVLAKHYGFTEEELDFIINYDIKYRMGRETDEGEG